MRMEDKNPSELVTENLRAAIEAIVRGNLVNAQLFAEAAARQLGILVQQ